MKLERSLDVHETRNLLVDPDANAEQDERRVSIAGRASEADNAAILNVLKAKILDLEAKLSQMPSGIPTEPTPFYDEDKGHFDQVMRELAPEASSAPRKSARPMLNRVSWVPFKNLYPDEDVFAIDVLMVLKSTSLS